MSDEKNKTTKNIKPLYETPVIVPLGELARGSGSCGIGSNPSDVAGGWCKDGANAYGTSGLCNNGTSAGKTCVQGGNQ